MAGAIGTVKRAIGQGDLLAAHDLAMSAIEAGEDDPLLRYYAVLSLARMGDARHALKLFERFNIGAHDDVDAAALKGRLLKDLARTLSGERRTALFAEASAAYLDAYRAHHAYFPAINAASTALLAGDKEAASSLAGQVLAHPDILAFDDYYAAASALEASLLTGDAAGALQWLDRALAAPDADAGSRATTCRQMALLGSVLPEMHDTLAVICAKLKSPPIIAYTGHMFRENGAGEGALRARIGAALDELGTTIAYGALACGADIMIAEAILARGGELNVVLPFAEADFVTQSVIPGGASWETRYQTCLDNAASVTRATETGFVGDPAQFAYGTRIALGLATIRARHLLADPLQFAVVQRGERAGPAGTGHDVSLWARFGHQTVMIDPGLIDRSMKRPSEKSIAERAQHSILFADFAGFSQLTENLLPVFVNDVMGRIAAVLDAHKSSVLSRNTWGDALYAVIDSPAVAAEIALQQQKALATLPEAFGSTVKGAGMRIGVHHGPVFQGNDPVMGRPVYYGTEVTRTARIEPVTPTGEVYVTQAFAAILALEAPDRFALEYVGRIKLAKGYGTLAMYRLSMIET